MLLSKNINAKGLFDLQKGLFRLDNTNSLSISLDSGLQIGLGTTFEVSSTGSQTHSISLNGLFANNGALNLNNSNGKANLFLIGSGNTYFSGLGANALNEVTVNKSSLSDSVIFAVPFTVPSSFFTLSKGYFKLSGTYTLNNTFFKSASNSYSIPQNSAFVLDNPNVIISGQDAQMSLGGELNLNKGSMTVGLDSIERSIVYSNGSTIKIGSDPSVALSVGSGIHRLNPTDSISYTQSGGVITLGALAPVTTANRAVFDIGANNSRFNVSGGSIELKNPSTTFDDYYVQADSGTSSGVLLTINPINPAQNLFSLKTKKAIGSLTLNGTKNPAVDVLDTLTVLGDVNLAGAGADRFKLNSSKLKIGGNLNNNLANIDCMNYGSSIVVLNSAFNQSIQGSQNSNFKNLSIEKLAGTVYLNKPCYIDSNLRIVSNTLFDLSGNDLTIGQKGNIYSDNGVNDDILSFSSSKGLVNSGTGINPFGARLIRQIPASPTLPYIAKFPIGSPGSYTPSFVQLEGPNGVTVASNASIGIKVVPLEHPASEVKGRSLLKYWNINSQNITINADGVTPTFYYNNSEVFGNEAMYRILYYSPAWNDPSGYWQIDPGQTNNFVKISQNLFYPQQTMVLNGDWTAGPPEVAKAIYYSRADGDYNDPKTWSKVDFDYTGDTSNTIPNKRSDVVRIQNHKVTVSVNTALASSINVEAGTSGRKSGKLELLNGVYCIGDTLKVEPTATLIIGDSLGISNAPTLSGNVRTTVRQYSTAANYEYNGLKAQILGDGLPNLISSLIVSKPDTSALTLNKASLIADSLVINSGKLDLGAYTVKWKCR